MTENQKSEIKNLRRKGALIALGVNVRKMLAPVLGRNGFLFSDILSNWTDIAKEAANGARPTALTFPKGQTVNGVLHLNAATGAHATAISARSEEIISLVNSFAGYNAVGSLKITQGAFIKKTAAKPAFFPPEQSPQTQKEIENAVQKIDSEELRHALQELGRLSGE